MDEEKYRFSVEWFDSSIKVKRSFLLTYYPSDKGVEMYDQQMKRQFLKRITCENIDLNDMYVGSVINVLCRQLSITGYGDSLTASKFTQHTEITIAIITSSGFRYLGKIIDVMQKNGFTFTKGRMAKIEGNDYANSSFITRVGPMFVVFEVRGDNIIGVWKKLIGISDSSPRVIREELGSLKQYCLGASDENLAKKELNIFFPPHKEIFCNTSVNENSTCCIIKPHTLREGTHGKIFQSILDAGFQILALQLLTFNLATASEFLEVYKGVVSNYKDMVGQLTSGTCIAIEVASEKEVNTVEIFREFVGPADSDIAKKIRPKSLRAIYGQDAVKNAVHCTDLPEDGKLEIYYIFTILSAQ